MRQNQVILIGYVGNHLLKSHAHNGTTRVRISVATHYRCKSKTTEPVYTTVWHDVVAWDNQASYAEENFVKGSRIMVDGFVEYRRFKDVNGTDRTITQIKAVSLINLDR